MRTPWTFTGDGHTATFSLPGRPSTDPKHYDVRVGGVPQPVTSFTLPKGDAVIAFFEAPPAAELVQITFVGG